MPPTVREWLDTADSFFFPRREKFRSSELPGGFELGSDIGSLLCAAGIRLSSQTDKQGLDVAVITSHKHRVVRIDEVSISGYFRPHMLEVGSCGAHSVGVNLKDYPFAHAF